jgi:hydrogenase/urease accessory protein HupE
MFRISKFTLAASLIVFASGPAFAHPGHGPDNPILHRIVHWVSGLDPMLAAMGGGVLALVVAAALLARSRRAPQR